MSISFLCNVRPVRWKWHIGLLGQICLYFPCCSFLDIKDFSSGKVFFLLFFILGACSLDFVNTLYSIHLNFPKPKSTWTTTITTITMSDSNVLGQATCQTHVTWVRQTCMTLIVIIIIVNSNCDCDCDINNNNNHVRPKCFGPDKPCHNQGA
jgi:hypothetical protein